MRRALILIVALGFSVLAAAGQVIRRSTAGGTGGGGGGGGTFALESVANSSQYLSSGTFTSGAMTYTVTSNTTLLMVATAWRRNIGQNISTLTWGAPTPQNFISIDDGGGSMACGLFYVLNPTPGTYNINVSMSAQVAGFAMSALTFTGVTQAPVTTNFVYAGSVNSSTATQTTAVGDFTVGVLVKQDPSSDNPVKNTSGDTLQNDFTFSSSGSGGFFKLTTSTATGTSTDSNFSWVGNANRAHLLCAVKP